MPRAVVNPEDQIYYVCTMYYYLVLCSSKKESKVIHRAYNLETHTHTHTHIHTHIQSNPSMGSTVQPAAATAASCLVMVM